MPNAQWESFKRQQKNISWPAWMLVGLGFVVLTALLLGGVAAVSRPAWALLAVPVGVFGALTVNRLWVRSRGRD